MICLFRICLFQIRRSKVREIYRTNFSNHKNGSSKLSKPIFISDFGTKFYKYHRITYNGLFCRCSLDFNLFVGLADTVYTSLYSFVVETSAAVFSKFSWVFMNSCGEDERGVFYNILELLHIKYTHSRSEFQILDL